MKSNNEKMYDSNTSPALNEALGKAPVEDLQQKIDFLRQCGVTEENIALIAGANIVIAEKLVDILDKENRPEVIDLTNNQLRRVGEMLDGARTRGYKTILKYAAENTPQDFDLRNRYGGKPANDELYGEDAQAA